MARVRLASFALAAIFHLTGVLRSAGHVLEPEDGSIDADFRIVPTDMEGVMLRKHQSLEELVREVPEIGWMLDRPGDNRLLYNPKHQSLDECNKDLISLTLSMTQNWTFSLFDSYGKLPSGILKGNFFWPGDFDECQSFVSPKTDLFPNRFRGRYCLTRLGSDNPWEAVTVGICVPRSCGTDEMNRDFSTLATLLRNISAIDKFSSKLPNVTFNCLPENVSLNSAAIGCVALLAVVFVLTMAGTLYDIFSNYAKSNRMIVIEVPPEHSENSSAEDHFVNGICDHCINEGDKISLVPDTSSSSNIVGEITLCFSAVKNGRAILDTSNRPGQLNCLHGIRFISMTWVILGHTYVFGVAQIENVLDLLDQLKTWPFQAIANATFSVDTFFLLSGFLVAYLFLKEPSKFTLKKLACFYLHRFIRLTPVFMAVLFVYATVFNFIGDGPYWSYALQRVNQCTKYWWRNLLYINNFFNLQNMCMAWSWYLANDMQFFVISPLFLVFLKSSKVLRRWIGLSIVVVLLLTSWTYTGILVKVDNIPVPLNDVAEGADEQAEETMFDEIYVKPWTRIGPYLIGCLSAFAFIQFKNTGRRITMACVIACWCGAIALALVDVYGLYNTKLGPVANAFYNALSRSAWAVAVAWLILACLTGNGGIVDRFLSWKLWFPLSRLTYCAYLTHPLVMGFYFQTLRSPIHLSNVVVAMHFIGFTVLSYGVAFITSLTLEAPVIKLEKLLRQKLT